MKLLLVDDEMATRQGLIRYVDWKKLGITEMRDVPGATKALVEVEGWQPDIIISDIRMPMMTGIELCYLLKSRLPNTQFIFISGFSDKEYLHAAIDLSVAGYIEKPLDIAKVEAVVQKAVNRILNEKKQKSRMEELQETVAENKIYLENRLVMQLIGGALDNHELYLSSDVFNIQKCKSWYYRSFSLSVKKDKKPKNYYNFFELKKIKESFPYDTCLAYREPYHMVGFIYAPKMEYLIGDEFIDRIQEWLQSYEESFVFLSIGSCKKSIDAIATSYEDAKKQEDLLFYMGYRHLACPENNKSLSDEMYVPDYERFKYSLRNHNYDSAVSYLRMIYDEIEKRLLTCGQVRGIYGRLLVILFNMNNEMLNEDTKQFGLEVYIWNMVTKTDTHNELFAYMTEKVDEFFNLFQELKQNNQNVLHIIGYIEDNYAKCDLSLSSVAEAVHLARTYMAAVFKKETGYTVGEYIMNIRMNHAKELLSQSNKQIQEVAEAVGFTEAKYFTKAFKKIVGMLPSEFRKVGL